MSFQVYESNIEAYCQGCNELRPHVIVCPEFPSRVS